MVFFEVDAIVAMDTNDANKSISFDIVGTPRSQQRPRAKYMPTVGRVVIYDPSATVKKHLANLCKKALVGHELLIFRDTTIKLEMLLTLYVTNTLKDVDNLLMFAMDALQKIVYMDDKMVFRSIVEKVEVATPDEEKTTIFIHSLN